MNAAEATLELELRLLAGNSDPAATIEFPSPESLTNAVFRSDDDETPPPLSALAGKEGLGLAIAIGERTVTLIHLEGHPIAPAVLEEARRIAASVSRSLANPT